VWQPARPPTAPRSWKDPREERPCEFAPPDFYYSDKSSNRTDDPPHKMRKLDASPKANVDADNERIKRLLAEVGCSKTESNEAMVDKSAAGPSPFNCSKSSSDLEHNTQTQTEKDSSLSTSEAEVMTSHAPYVPAAKPISMKLMSKSTKLLNTKTAFE